MPNDLIVHPGDLITAELWNKLQGLIDIVNARIDATEAIVVPDVIGDVLPTATGEIRRASLDVSTVLDAAGTLVDPTDTKLADRIVLAQMPSPEERVRVGRRVSLLISAARTKTANAPDITSVAPATARVGQPLDIIGTAFTGNIAVTFRNDTFRSGFTVTPTKITFASVPRFDGAPAPGNTLAIPITVANEIGTDSFSASFTEPQITVVRPVITNVRFLNAATLSILGSNFAQKLEASLTIGGQPMQFTPVSDSEIRVLQIPESVMLQLQALQSTQPTLFANLLRIDQRDLFLFDNVTSISPDVTAATLPTEFATARLAPGAFAGGLTELGPRATLLRHNPGKFFLILSAALAQTFANAANVALSFQQADLVVAATDKGATFSFAPSKLTDLSITIKVGDQSGTFPLKFGAVGGGRSFGPIVPVDPRFAIA
jgi:hypothetical protein